MAERTSRHESELLIGGKWVVASDGTYDIINPATEEVVGQAPNGSAADAVAAAAAAKEAQPAWAAWSVGAQRSHARGGPRHPRQVQ